MGLIGERFLPLTVIRCLAGRPCKCTARHTRLSPRHWHSRRRGNGIAPSLCVTSPFGVHLSRNIDTFPEIWTLAQNYGHLPRIMDTCPELWTLVQEYGHLPRNMGTCPERWTLAQNHGHLPRIVDTCPELWTLVQDYGHLPRNMSLQIWTLVQLH